MQRVSVTSTDVSKLHRRAKPEIVRFVGKRQPTGEFDGPHRTPVRRIHHRRPCPPRPRQADRKAAGGRDDTLFNKSVVGSSTDTMSGFLVHERRTFEKGRHAWRRILNRGDDDHHPRRHPDPPRPRHFDREAAGGGSEGSGGGHGGRIPRAGRKVESAGAPHPCRAVAGHSASSGRSRGATMTVGHVDRLYSGTEP